MLSHLHIENIALIDKLVLEFHSGLNIITGETGAGKSIVIDSINLLLGERADRNLIRAGKSCAYVEGVFVLDNIDEPIQILQDNGIQIDEGVLIIARELSTNGNNICRVNGRAVTLSTLKEISRDLIDIHGQHEHQSLLTVESHKIFLDRFGSDYIRAERDGIEKHYSQLMDIRNEIKKIQSPNRDGIARKDFLEYQLSEITEANLERDEEDELLEERKTLQNSEDIIENIKIAYDSLYSGGTGIPSVYDSLGNISSRISGIVEFDRDLSELSDRLDNIYYELEDCIDQLRDYINSFYFDEGRLDQVQNRLNLINDLKRKYGSTVNEIIKYGEELELELRQIERSGELLETLKEEEGEKIEKLYGICKELSSKRRTIADTFEVQLLEQLYDLGMEKTKFAVIIESNDKNISKDGYDEIEFLISPNPGEPLRPLAKIASGGEIARIMLAFKTILAEADNVPTLIFDEIDVGISGRIAESVSHKMAMLSSTHQLICVTHLPQIAAMADRHFMIEKYMDENKTYTTANILPEDQRQVELAKMIGGTNVSQLSLDHARELITNSKQFKSNLKSVKK